MLPSKYCDKGDLSDLNIVYLRHKNGKPRITKITIPVFAAFLLLRNTLTKCKILKLRFLKATSGFSLPGIII